MAESSPGCSTETDQDERNPPERAPRGPTAIGTGHRTPLHALASPSLSRAWAILSRIQPCQHLPSPVGDWRPRREAHGPVEWAIRGPRATNSLLILCTGTTWLQCSSGSRNGLVPRWRSLLLQDQEASFALSLAHLQTRVQVRDPVPTPSVPSGSTLPRHRHLPPWQRTSHLHATTMAGRQDMVPGKLGALELFSLMETQSPGPLGRLLSLQGGRGRDLMYWKGQVGSREPSCSLTCLL